MCLLQAGKYAKLDINDYTYNLFYELINLMKD